MDTGQNGPKVAAYRVRPFSVSFIGQHQFLSTRILVPIPLQSRLYDLCSLAAIDLSEDLD
jgi:hypothetical protein